MAIFVSFSISTGASVFFYIDYEVLGAIASIEGKIILNTEYAIAENYSAIDYLGDNFSFPNQIDSSTNG